MTIDQIIAILANGIPNGLGYILFLYLFYETRRDNRDAIRSAIEREEKVKQESEKRELWFRQAVEKQQANEATVAESLRRLVEKMESVDERLQRIELQPRPRRGE